jgi:hypothetical protein
MTATQWLAISAPIIAELDRWEDRLECALIKSRGMADYVHTDMVENYDPDLMHEPTSLHGLNERINRLMQITARNWSVKYFPHLLKWCKDSLRLLRGFSDAFEAYSGPERDKEALEAVETITRAFWTVHAGSF